MNRAPWIRRIATGLVLGVVATVGICWCVELTAPELADAQDRFSFFKDPATGLESSADEYSSFAWRTIVVGGALIMDGGARRYDDAPPPWLPAARQPNGLWGQTQLGWPLYAMRSGERSTDASLLPTLTVPFRGRDRFLPLVPIWRGLLVDTAFYASAYVALAAAASGFQSFRRRRLGKCPTCSYSLRGLLAGAPCPECGTGAAPAE